MCHAAVQLTVLDHRRHDLGDLPVGGIGLEPAGSGAAAPTAAVTRHPPTDVLAAGAIEEDKAGQDVVARGTSNESHSLRRLRYWNRTVKAKRSKTRTPGTEVP